MLHQKYVCPHLKKRRKREYSSEQKKKKKVNKTQRKIRHKCPSQRQKVTKNHFPSSLLVVSTILCAYYIFLCRLKKPYQFTPGFNFKSQVGAASRQDGKNKRITKKILFHNSQHSLFLYSIFLSYYIFFFVFTLHLIHTSLKLTYACRLKKKEKKQKSVVSLSTHIFL